MRKKMKRLFIFHVFGRGVKVVEAADFEEAWKELEERLAGKRFVNGKWVNKRDVLQISPPENFVLKENDVIVFAKEDGEDEWQDGRLYRLVGGD